MVACPRTDDDALVDVLKAFAVVCVVTLIMHYLQPDPPYALLLVVFGVWPVGAILVAEIRHWRNSRRFARRLVQLLSDTRRKQQLLAVRLGPNVADVGLAFATHSLHTRELSVLSKARSRAVLHACPSCFYWGKLFCFTADGSHHAWFVEDKDKVVRFVYVRQAVQGSATLSFESEKRQLNGLRAAARKGKHGVAAVVLGIDQHIYLFSGTASVECLTDSAMTFTFC